MRCAKEGGADRRSADSVKGLSKNNAGCQITLLSAKNVSVGNLSEVSCMLTPYGRSYLEVVAALKSHFLHASSRMCGMVVLIRNP